MHRGRFGRDRLRPRLTLDTDLVVALSPSQLDRLFEVFAAEEFYLPPKEVFETDTQRESRGHFNIIHQHSALRADCYLPGRSELARWELAHRRRLPIGSTEAWFAPPESVIVNKLLFFREGGSAKHLDDIRAMLDCAQPIDRKILLEWVRKLGLQTEWSAVRPD